MNVDALVNTMSPEIYEKLRNAVETGKWLDGSPLSDEQKETCMQAVMLYQSKIIKSEEHMTVGETGEIVQKSRQQFKQEFTHQDSIARFKQDDF